MIKKVLKKHGEINKAASKVIFCHHDHTLASHFDKNKRLLHRRLLAKTIETTSFSFRIIYLKISLKKSFISAQLFSSASLLYAIGILNFFPVLSAAGFVKACKAPG